MLGFKGRSEYLSADSSIASKELLLPRGRRSIRLLWAVSYLVALGTTLYKPSCRKDCSQVHNPQPTIRHNQLGYLAQNCHNPLGHNRSGHNGSRHVAFLARNRVELSPLWRVAVAYLRDAGWHILTHHILSLAFGSAPGSKASCKKQLARSLIDFFGWF